MPFQQRLSWLPKDYYSPASPYSPVDDFVKSGDNTRKLWLSKAGNKDQTFLHE
jgi:hypothetical protein